jgi:hypothetical protein
LVGSSWQRHDAAEVTKVGDVQRGEGIDALVGQITSAAELQRQIWYTTSVDNEPLVKHSKIMPEHAFQSASLS